MLNDKDKFIKDNLLNIIDGKFNDKFNPEELKMMLELSFLYNHTTIENTSIIFNYNGSKLTFSTTKGYDLWLVGKDTFISTIRNDNLFKSSLTQFLRDLKLNKIGI
jgi:hypothetical protein